MPRGGGTVFGSTGMAKADRQPRPGAWVKLPYAVMAANLSWSAKGLLCYLRDRLGKNPDCWPGMRRICADLHFANRHVAITAIEDAEGARFLAVERNGRGKQNRYRLTAAALA